MGLLGLFKGKEVVKKEYAPGLFQRISGQYGMSDSPRLDHNNIDKAIGRYADQAWIYSCIRIIQTKAAGVPLKVYRAGKDMDESEWLADHPLQLLLDKANPFMSGYDLREATHGYVDLTGNSYWLLDKMIGGQPTEIYPINPAQIRIKADKTSYVSGYEFMLQPGVVERIFKPEEVLHFKTWNPTNPFYGLAPICSARDSSDMMMFSDQYNKAFFRNGAEPGGYLVSDQSLEEEEKKRITSIWSKLHKGFKKAFNVAILDGGLKFQSTATSHKDMNFGELKRMTREDVLTVFNIPPIMVGVFDEANYSNAKEQRRIFWVDCVVPRLRKIESILNESLCPLYGADIFVEHDLKGIEDLAEDAVRRAQADNYNTTGGILTINEVREQRSLPPVPWGDAWWAPFGAEPITGIEKEEPEEDDEPVVPKPPKPGPEEDDDEPEEEKILQPAEQKDVLRRDGIWFRYKGFTENQERKWSPALRRLFTDQEREVIANLRSSDWQRTLNQNRLEKMRNVKASIEVVLFDRVRARTVFRKDGNRLMTDTISASAKKEIDDYDLGINFDIKNPAVQNWINSKSFKFADEVNTSTEEALRRHLTEAIEAGETLSQVEERIAQVFDIARGPRTATIARTEVISASNEGALASYKQSGLVEKTEWITSRDNRVRDEHQIDGQKRAIGEVFSNGLLYPGDPAGEPGNVINCRCTIAPIVSKAE